MLKVAILPAESDKPMEAVKAQLNNMLFRYSDDLEGVPMMYYDMKCPPGKEYGRILNDSPWLHIDILVKLLLFQPQTKQAVIGQINKVRCAPYRRSTHLTPLRITSTRFLTHTYLY